MREKMMKRFTIEKVGKNCERIATWELPRHSPIQSPGLWLTSSIGGVPHLTPETFEMSGIQELFCGVLFSYEKQARSIDVFEAYKKGFMAFCGFKNYPSLLTILDPMIEIKKGFNTVSSISVWGENNQREAVDRDHFLRGLKTLDPDAFISLCDSDSGKEASGKRLQKAVKFTHEALEHVREKMDDSKALIGPLLGGYDKSVREKEAKYYASLPLDGYFLDGFHSNGDSALEMNIEEVKEILQECVIPNLKSDKPKFFFGKCDPLSVIELTKQGVDFFETSYAYHLCELGHAMIFANSLKNQEISEDLPSKVSSKGEQNSSNIYIDLNDNSFKNDFGPILKNCSCYACRKHTRGYINHLLATKELLAKVLLVIHNLHHYGTFFLSIREAIKDDKLGELESRIKSS